MNRQDDLMKVFNNTWSANHNDVAKRGREKEKDFVDRMFNVKKKQNNDKAPMSSQARVDELQKNMNGAATFQRQTQMNNIVKKWK